MDASAIGMELAKRLAKVVGDYRNLKTDFNAEMFNVRDVSGETLVREATVLTYTFQRLAIMFFGGQACLRDAENRRRIAGALDRYVSEVLTDVAEFQELMDNNGEQYDDLMDSRGITYFQLMKTHRDEIANKDWGGLIEAVQARFEQFCRGGGREGGPFIVGSVFSMLPLNALVVECWTEGYAETVKILVEHDK